MITSIEHKGYTIRIVQDQDPESPRTWDNLGTIAVKASSRYLGGYAEADPEEVALLWVNKTALVLPLYAYVHSGIVFGLSPFSCMWDSGQCGFIYVTHEKIAEEFGEVNETTLEQARKVLEGEVDTLNIYVSGSVLGYQVIDKEGDDVESCYGFFDPVEYVVEQAKEAVEGIHARYAEVMASA